MAIYFKTFILPWLFFLSFSLSSFLSFFPFLRLLWMFHWFKGISFRNDGIGGRKHSGDAVAVVVVGHRGNAGGSPWLRSPRGSGRDPTKARRRSVLNQRRTHRRENNIGVSPKAASLLAREMDFPVHGGKSSQQLGPVQRRAALPRLTFLSSFQPVTDRSGKNRDHLDLKLTKNP